MLTTQEIRKVNKEMRAKDDSKLWPICGKFNATDRAIRRINKARKQGLDFDSELAYELTLESEISQIVNSII